MSNLKPSEIVQALDKYIIGQNDAKKSVAIALRNRWRRRQLDKDLVGALFGKVGNGETFTIDELKTLSQGMMEYSSLLVKSLIENLITSTPTIAI